MATVTFFLGLIYFGMWFGVLPMLLGLFMLLVRKQEKINPSLADDMVPIMRIFGGLLIFVGFFAFMHAMFVGVPMPNFL